VTLIAVIGLISTSGQTALDLEHVPGTFGATAFVPVHLRHPPREVVAAQFDTVHEPGNLHSDTPVRTERLAQHIVKSRELAPGVRRTLVYSLSNASVTGTNGPILRLPFQVPAQDHDGAGPILLTTGSVVLARADGAAATPVSGTGGSVFFRPIHRRPEGAVRVYFSSEPERRYVIQATANLVDWVNLSTNLVLGDFLSGLDFETPGTAYRFYRSRPHSP
jgi:hypothetical protein